MVANKSGLADLKRLQQAAEARRKREQAQAQARAKAAQVIPPLAEDDARLFRQAVRAVEPLRRKPGSAQWMAGANLPAEMLAAKRKQAMGDASPSLALSPHMSQAVSSESDDTVFLRAGHGPDVLRDLRKGRWSVQASIDLHGNTVEEARRRLEGFMADCLAYGARCVRVVHGVGYGSPDGLSVLGPQVARWLISWEAVQAYAACGPAEGGRGALRVLLKAKN